MPQSAVPKTQARPWPTTTPPSLLIAVLDLHPLSWSLLADLSSATGSDGRDKPPISPITLTEFANIVMVFLNAHLASRWGNQVVVYGATADKAVLLYPPPTDRAGPSRPNPNLYRPFQLLDTKFEESLKALAAKENEALKEGRSLNDEPALVSALTKALCNINRRRPSDAAPGTAEASGRPSADPEALESRIMVINATPGGAEDQKATSTQTAKASGGSGGQRGYVGLMNCVFAAQKVKVPIDVLTLPPESTKTAPPIFLQQAAHLTNGIYWRWNGRGGLLQYLHSIYLTPPSLRLHPFTKPPQDAVDFRAVCFCHNDVVDVGFVCSVCLSIFCEVKPFCPMCRTKFPIRNLGTLKQLAANIEPIPVPASIPPARQRRLTNGAGARPQGVSRRSIVENDVIVLD